MEGPGAWAGRGADRSGLVSFSALKALMAGSALKGAWLSEGDHEQGSVGLRCSCDFLLGSRNRAGMTGTSGSEARRIVDRGDFRMLAEDVERLAEETEEVARVGDKGAWI